MRITSVRITKNEKDDSSKFLAYADVVIDNAIAIHGIKVIQGEENKFLSFPSVRRTSSDGQFTYSDIVHPLNNEVRTLFEEAIFAELEKAD